AGQVLVLPHLHVRVRDLLPREDLAHARIDALLEHEAVGERGLFQVCEMRALNALLPHPDVTRIERQIVAGGAGAEHDHPAALHDEAGDRERRLAGMLEDDVDVALSGDLPDRLAEAARLFGPGIVFVRADLRHLTPAIEILAVDESL